ncbi:ATP-binding protein [Haloferax profundi]|uniref:ATPase n=1 Tax=Haloferax profundi TaxID=1544718 RepID=A0A0W1SVJ8_9EURY|nr:ATP-binding protein [Haloferax profundi]KTG30352.1 ATPase [Haloferax profundi]
MTFYNRTAELTALEEGFETDDHSFVVVYGRRRVGKTELLKQFCSEHPHVYYLAAQEAEPQQLNKFVTQVATAFDDRVPRIEGWDEAFDYLGDLLESEPRVIVIDEFPYLIDSNDSILSYLQAFVDERLKQTEAMLVLCGSSISVMESDVLGHKSPLYGRRTHQLDITPFNFRDARSVIEYDVEDAIRSYAVTGGTPMYLTLFEYSQSLAENIESQVLSQNSLLYNEPEFLLRTELRSPARYLSILEAIATGHTTPNEIAGMTGVNPGPLSKYLQTLRRLRLIERETPVTVSSAQSKRSLYRISDEFLRFWFRYVEPNRSSITEIPEVVLQETILPDLQTHVSTVFERICREVVWEAIRRNELEPYGSVGRWWYGEHEIDIVGLSPADDRILFAECKWTSSPVGQSLVEDLKAKTENVRWGTPDRTEQFALFSKGGFTDGLADELDESWTLFDLQEIDRLTDT